MDTRPGVHISFFNTVLGLVFGCPRPMARGQSDLQARAPRWPSSACRSCTGLLRASR